MSLVLIHVNLVGYMRDKTRLVTTLDFFFPRIGGAKLVFFFSENITRCQTTESSVSRSSIELLDEQSGYDI